MANFEPTVESFNITYLVFHLNNLLTEAWLISDLLLPSLSGWSSASSPGARSWGAGWRSQLGLSIDWWRLILPLLWSDGCWCMSLWLPSGCKKIIVLQITVKVCNFMCTWHFKIELINVGYHKADLIKFDYHSVDWIKFCYHKVESLKRKNLWSWNYLSLWECLAG